jgi:uncharacterized membrane protein
MEEKHIAFLAYLLSIVGAFYVLFARRKEEFAVYHARQSLGIGGIAIGLLVGWFIVLWVLTWIPWIGFILGIAIFALVIAAYIMLTISCIRGMMNALQLKKQPVPVVGEYASQVSAFILQKIGY